MATTPWFNPTDDNIESRSGATQWIAPGNIYASDDSDAYCDIPKFGSTYWLIALAFGFDGENGVPAGATIEGIEVEVERQGENATSTKDGDVYLCKSIGRVGNDKGSAVYWPTTDGNKSYGGAADPWGAGLTAADVRASTFGVHIWAANQDTENTRWGRIDHIKVRITYTPSGEDIMLAAVVAGVATAAVAAKVAKKLAAVVAGVASVTGATKIAKKFAAVTAGIATVTGAVKMVKKLQSLSEGVASIASVLKLDRGVQAAIIGGTIVVASSKISKKLQALAAGVASVVVVLKPVRGIQAAIAGSTTVATHSKVLKKLSAAVAGSTIVAGLVSITKKLQATAAGIASATASLGISGVQYLAAVIAGVTTASGSINVLRKLQAVVVGIASVVATMKPSRRLQAIIAGVAAVTSSASITKKLAAAVTGVASVTASVRGVFSLAAVSDGVAGVIAALTTAGGEIDLQVEADLDDVEQIETGVVIDSASAVRHRSYNIEGGRRWGAHRWVNGSLPPTGATITVCHAKFYIAYGANDPNGNWHFEKAASPAQFVVEDNNVTDRPRTSASVAWVVDDIGLGWQQSPSLVSVLQEVVDSHSPTALVLIFRPNQDATKTLLTIPHNHDPTEAAKLHIEWSGGAVAVLLAAVVAGIASVSAAIKVNRRIAGVIAGVASVTGAANITKKLQAVATGIASVAANMKPSRRLQATIIGVATAVGSAKIVRGLQTVIAGTASVVGALTVKGVQYLAAVIGGETVVSAAASITARLKAVISGIASVLANLRVAAVGAPVAANLSTVNRLFGIKTGRKRLDVSVPVGRVISVATTTRNFVASTSRFIHGLRRAK